MPSLLETIEEVDVWDDRAAAYNRVVDCPDCLVFQRKFYPDRENYRGIMFHKGKLYAFTQTILLAGFEEILDSDKRAEKLNYMRLFILEGIKRRAKAFLDRQVA